MCLKSFCALLEFSNLRNAGLQGTEVNINLADLFHQTQN